MYNIFYSFNLASFYNYDGTIPCLNYFLNVTDDEKLCSDKTTFYDNYVSNSNKNSWNFKEELIKRSLFKTRILAKSCLTFLRETINFQVNLIESLQLKENLILHPFAPNVLTLASLSYKIFCNFYLNNEIVYACESESTSKVNISRAEFEFASFLDYKYPQLKYQHAFSSSLGQKRFGNYSVDIYSPVSKTVIQFQGCHFHLHLWPDCKNKSRRNLTESNALTLSKKNKETIKKEQVRFESYLREKFPDEVLEIQYEYECDWTETKKSTEYLDFLKKQVVNTKRPLTKLSPRVGQRGGLLEQYKLKWSKAENPNERFVCADINALYSYVALTKKMPIDKPVIIIGADLKRIHIENNQLFFESKLIETGLIHCSILPPQNEKFPFLQFRVEDRFNYLALCQSCAKTNSTVCRHRSANSRKFTSVWTVQEIYKALSENYQLLDIFEIHFFPKTKYLLRHFVQCLGSLRLKNSGGVEKLKTKEEKMSYCENLNSVMNLPPQFALNISNVKDNAIQKKLYKDMLNSFFGKFSSHSNTSKSEIVYSQHRLEEIFSQYKVLDAYNLNENSLLVEYEQDDLRKLNLKTNLYIGSTITSYARIILHDYVKQLEKAGIEIYSIDTDSIFYVLKENDVDPIPFSDAFGHFKHILGQTSEILSYHSLGCRNYCILYRDVDNNLQSVVKCKGLSLESNFIKNNVNADLYETFINQNFLNEFNSVLIPQIRYKLDKADFKKKSTLQNFAFKNDLYLKRYVTKSSFDTFPFGYVNK